MQNQKLILFVNGYTYGCKPYEAYWTEKGTQFLDAANAYFGGNCNFHFINGEAPWYSGAAYRFRKGQKLALNSSDLLSKLEKYQEIFFVTHSMGAAYAEGMLTILNKQGIQVSKVVHFSAADACKIQIPEATSKITRLQLGMSGDKTISRHANPFTHYHRYKIPSVEIYGEVLSRIDKMHPLVLPKDRKKWNFHYDTKTFAQVWDYLNYLEGLSLIEEQKDTYISVNHEEEKPIFRILFKKGLLLEFSQQNSEINYLVYKKIYL